MAHQIDMRPVTIPERDDAATLMVYARVRDWLAAHDWATVAAIADGLKLTDAEVSAALQYLAVRLPLAWDFRCRRRHGGEADISEYRIATARRG